MVDLALAASTTSSLADQGTPPMSTLPAALAATGSTLTLAAVAAALAVAGVVSWTVARRRL